MRGHRENQPGDSAHSPHSLNALVGLLNAAVRVVPAAKYFWGVIAASATVAIISLLTPGLNRLTFVAMLAAFVAMFIFYVFSRFERSPDAVVRLVGHALIIVTGLAFIFVIGSSAWLALTCRSLQNSSTAYLFAYLYGVDEVCYPKPPDAAASKVDEILQNIVLASKGQPLRLDYSRIPAPLSTFILSYYLSENRYPAHLLLSLAISEIITYNPYTRRRYHIPNTVSNLEFSSALYGLRAIGLTVESVNEVVSISPALTEEEARDPKLLAGLGGATGNTPLTLKRYSVIDPSTNDNGDPNFSKSEYDRLKGNTTYFRLEKENGQKYAICFDRTIVEDSLAALQLRLPAIIPTTTLPGAGVVRIEEKDLCGVNLHRKRDTGFNEVSGRVMFQTRSVIGVISFLGEVVRSNKPLTVFETPRGGKMIVIFATSTFPPDGPSMSTTVDGHTYYLKVDQTGNDMSSRVLQLLAELVALKNST